MNAGADVNAGTPETSETVLHTVAARPHPEKIDLLLQLDAYPSPSTSDKVTPLHIAVSHALQKHNEQVDGYANMLGSILLGDMAVSAQQVGGGELLDSISHTGYMQSVRLLVLAGADVSLRDSGDCTPLDLVAREARQPAPHLREKSDFKGAGETFVTLRWLLEWVYPGWRSSSESIPGFLSKGRFQAFCSFDDDRRLGDLDGEIDREERLD